LWGGKICSNNCILGSNNYNKLKLNGPEFTFACALRVETHGVFGLEEKSERKKKEERKKK